LSTGFATVLITVVCANDAPVIVRNGIGDLSDENKKVIFRMINSAEHVIDYVQ
jgi:hypothetical protein